MKDRERIAEIIKKNGTYNGRSLSFDYYVVKPDDLADALIAAGIGDVKSWKISDASKEQSSINYYCEMREWKDKCKEAEHRAELEDKIENGEIDYVADSKTEQTITDLLIEFDEMGFAPTTVCPNLEQYATEWRERVRKEFARLTAERDEYKHRAEVAERAFLILWKERKEKLGWNIDCTMWYAKQAEKELEEEKKNGK